MEEETLEITEDRELQEEMLRRMEHEAYRYYEPTGKGEEFIDLVKSGDYFMGLFSAANGIGKTATMMNVFAHLFWPTGENQYFTGGFFDHFPYRKKGLFVTTPSNIEKTMVPGLKEWFPKGRYKTKKKGKPYEASWTTDTGWAFDIMTYEQDPQEFEGGTYGFIWCDEPPPEAIFKALISRLRKGGILIISATPLAGSAYLFDIFLKGDMEVEVSATEGGETEKVKRKVFYIEADVESACREHGIRGHLKHEDIMNMVAEYSEDEKQARMYGKFQHLVGLVFKKFDRKVHVIEPFNIDMRNFSVWQALDTHPRNPDAALWIATDRKGTWYVIDELYIKAMTPELAAKIKNKDSQYRVVRRILEPAAAIVNQHDEDGKSLMDRLSDNGLSYELATKQRTQANKRIEDALDYTMVNGHMLRAPEVFIFSTCKRLIKEIEGYRWDDYTGKTADKHDPKGTPIDKDDHMIEDLGRILIQEPKFVEVPQKRTYEAKSLDPYA